MVSSKKNTSDKKTSEEVASNLGSAEPEVASALLEEVNPEVGDILDKLAPDEKRVISTMISYQGPLPPPHLLKGYAETYPEAPEKIFSMAESQQKHRQELEKDGLKKTYKYQLSGLIFGFIITLVLIIGAIVLILMDKEVIGISLLGPTFIGLVTLLVLQKRKHNSANDNDSEDEYDDE